MSSTFRGGSWGSLALALVATLAACGGGGSTRELVQPGDIIGRVEAVDGLPLRGCQVLIEGSPKGALCDDNGEFHIVGVPSGRWELRIMPGPDDDIPGRRIQVAANPGFVNDIGAVRIAAPGFVGGHIDTAGATLPFSIVTVPAYGAATSPDSNTLGYLLNGVPPGRHDLLLMTDGGMTIKADIDVAPATITLGVDFELADVAPVTATIRGKASRGDASGDGGIQVDLIEVLNGTTTADTRTADDGSFSLQAGQGVYQLRARDGDRAATAVIPFLVVAGPDDIVLENTMVIPSGDDLDGDGLDDDADDDTDGDGVANTEDALPFDPAEFADTDADGVGDRADLRRNGEAAPVDGAVETPDSDGDTFLDFEDVCPNLPDPLQPDADGDRVGDDCDNCPYVPNADQADVDEDDTGDVCELCINGEPCTPSDVCQEGRLTCTAGGGALCAGIGSAVANGTPCGSAQVCNNGVCGACMAGETCALDTDPCAEGVVSCSTGVAVCQPTGRARVNGSSCGTDQVCREGVCGACDAGAECPSSVLCHEGALACSTGAPVCVDSGAWSDDGTSCGSGLVCRSGTCQRCDQGAPCTPTTPACHAGHLDCSTGTGVCVDDGTPSIDGIPCGVSGRVCSAGACVVVPNELELISGGGQSGAVGSSLALVTVRLTDGGGVPLAGQLVSFTAPAGGEVTPASATTSTDGRATFVPRLPPTPGPATFTAFTASATPLSIAETATPLPTGGTGTIVNADHANGSTPLPAPATSSRIGTPIGLVRASDGTIYFVDSGRYRVLALSPSGQLSSFVNRDGSYGHQGDFGLAVEAHLVYPSGLALDEARGALYVTDSDRVRRVNLTTGIIDTVAGGGTAPAPGYGDGGPATQAVFGAINSVAVAADGTLLVSDGYYTKLRKVVVGGLITPFIERGTCTELTLYSCPGYTCPLLYDTDGTLYLGGTICGVDGVTTTTSGVLAIAPDGTMRHVAGNATGTTGPGASARRTQFGQIEGLAFDAAGNLLVSDSSRHVIRRIDGTTSVVSHVAGTGTAGVSGELSTADTSPINSPLGLVVEPGGTLVFADSGNFSLRRIGGVGRTVATTATIAVSGGSGQSAALGGLTPAPLAVTVTSGGSPVASVPVTWTPLDPGGAMTADVSSTDGSGIARSTVRVGLQPGAFRVRAETVTLHGTPLSGSPVTITSTATAPTAGTVFSAVNVDHTAGTDTLGNSCEAHVASPGGIAQASDGTIYFVSGQRIVGLTPAGELFPVAGDGTAGFIGDFGPATDARFYYPHGLFLDEPRHRLLVADQYNHRVRSIDLESGLITTVVGGGAATPPTYGDGGDALSAELSYPKQVSVGPDNAIYVGDSYHNRIRRVDPVTNVITSVVQPGTCADPVALSSCAGESCAMVWQGTNLYITGYLCGTQTNGYAYGIVRRDAGGTLTHVLGYQGGSAADGVAPTAAVATAISGIDLTSTNDIVYSENHRIRRIAGGTVTTLGGTGTAGSTGDLGPATSALFYYPNVVMVDPGGHIWVGDSSSYAIRVIW